MLNRKILILLLLFCPAVLAGNPVNYTGYTWHPKATAQVTQISQSSLHDYQIINLLIARKVASRYFPLDKGENPKEFSLYKQLIAGIMWQESHAGESGPVGDMKDGFGRRSYGLMQVKLDVAQKMLKQHPLVSRDYLNTIHPADEMIIATLIYNPEFNVTIACLYLNYLHSTYRLSWTEAVTAYNRGIGGLRAIKYKESGYTRSVLRHRKFVSHALLAVRS